MAKEKTKKLLSTYDADKLFEPFKRSKEFVEALDNDDLARAKKIYATFLKSVADAPDDQKRKRTKDQWSSQERNDGSEECEKGSAESYKSSVIDSTAQAFTEALLRLDARQAMDVLGISPNSKEQPLYLGHSLKEFISRELDDTQQTKVGNTIIAIISEIAKSQRTPFIKVEHLFHHMAPLGGQAFDTPDAPRLKARLALIPHLEDEALLSNVADFRYWTWAKGDKKEAEYLALDATIAEMEKRGIAADKVANFMVQYDGDRALKSSKYKSLILSNLAVLTEGNQQTLLKLAFDSNDMDILKLFKAEKPELFHEQVGKFTFDGFFSHSSKEEADDKFRQRLDAALSADAVLPAAYTAFQFLHRIEPPSNEKRAIAFEKVKEFLSAQAPNNEVKDAFARLEDIEKMQVLTYLAEWNTTLADTLLETTKSDAKFINRAMAYAAISGRAKATEYFLDKGADANYRMEVDIQYIDKGEPILVSVARKVNAGISHAFGGKLSGEDTEKDVPLARLMEHPHHEAGRANPDVHKSFVAIAELLLERNANPLFHAEKGLNALHELLGGHKPGGNRADEDAQQLIRKILSHPKAASFGASLTSRANEYLEKTPEKVIAPVKKKKAEPVQKMEAVEEGVTSPSAPVVPEASRKDGNIGSQKDVTSPYVIASFDDKVLQNTKFKERNFDDPQNKLATARENLSGALAKGNEKSIDEAMKDIMDTYKALSPNLKDWQAQKLVQEDLGALENARAGLKMASLSLNPDYIDPAKTEVVQSEGQKQKRQIGDA